MAGLLRDRFDQVQVQQLGSDGPAELAVNQPAVLLRLSLPPPMEQEARERLSASAQKQYLPVLYELSLGKSPKP